MADDTVRISINKDEEANGDGSLKTTIGSSSVNSAQATNALQAQLSAISSKTVFVGGKAITYRQIIFFVVTFALFATAIGLMVTVILGDQQLSYERSMVTCTDYDCYKSASATQRKVNMTAYGACDNFYQYACNGWIRNQMLMGNERELTILTELEAENLKRLNDAIMGELDPMRMTDWAYEGKLQRYYKTCLNQYQTTNYYKTSNPVIAEILNMGGWYVLDSAWNPSSFKWVEAHKFNLARDNWVDAFFYYDIEAWDQQHSTYILTVREDIFLGLPYNKWNVTVKDYVTPYKTFLTNVAKLMAEDANVKDAGLDTRIKNFVTDVTTVEKALADLIKKYESDLTSNRYQLRTLFGMNPIAKGFSWVDFFRAVLEGTTRPVDALVPIVVKTPNILDRMSGYIGGFDSKQFNNYLVWRLIYSYMADMSYEYNHLLLNWEATLRGTASEYKPSWVFCLERARGYMPDALDGEYVRRHFNKLDKDEITFLSETIRRSVSNEVGNLDWMDDDTRKTASDKVAKTIEKLGYPETFNSELTLQNQLDFTYKNVNITNGDNFLNVKELRNHRRREFVGFYTVGRDPYSDWRETPLYSIKSTYYYPWNELLVPAGLLQFPIFSGANPAMYRMQTYGSAGFRLARGYLYGIGENGKWFDKFGNQLSNPWWSEASSKNYAEKKDCYTKWYGAVHTGDLKLDNGRILQGKLSRPEVYATQAAIDIGALRNAYTAYVSSDVQGDAKTSTELFLPGVPAQSKSEYFFLAFAQSQCAIRHDQVTYDRMNELAWLPEELMVNNVLMNLAEFSSIYQCPAGSPMNPSDRCQAIF